MSQTWIWVGASEVPYRYEVYPVDHEFPAVPGNYIFVNNEQHPIYAGQTSNLSKRLDDHHKTRCIDRHGATYIHAHANGDEQARLDEEADIIRKHQPLCNG